MDRAVDPSDPVVVPRAVVRVLRVDADRQARRHDALLLSLESRIEKRRARRVRASPPEIGFTAESRTSTPQGVEPPWLSAPGWQVRARRTVLDTGEMARHERRARARVSCHDFDPLRPTAGAVGERASMGAVRLDGALLRQDLDPRVDRRLDGSRPTEPRSDRPAITWVLPRYRRRRAGHHAG